MAATFRNAPMGFNKKDVIEYIEKLVGDKNASIESAWAEYKALESRAAKQTAELEEDIRRERMVSAGRIGELQAQLTQALEEKQLMEERALGSEQAFADLEAAMNELRTSHAEELNAIYAERSALLDQKAERIRALEAEGADKDAELESLRSCNKRLLLQVDQLEQAARAYADMDEEEEEDEALPIGSQALLAAFKTRFIEITGELSQLAHAILEAEKRESRIDVSMADQGEEDYDFGNDDLLTFPVDLSDDDLPEGEGEDDEADLPDFWSDLPEETPEEAPAAEEAERPAARIEMTDYPDPARAPKPVQKKGPSVRDLLDRLRTIGDRLL